MDQSIIKESDMLEHSYQDISDKDGPTSSYDGSKTTNHSTLSPPKQSAMKGEPFRKLESQPTSMRTTPFGGITEDNRKIKFA